MQWRALLLGLVTAFMPAWVFAEQGGIVGTLDGTATVSRAMRPSVVALSVKDDLFIDDQITTAGRSRVRMILGNTTIVTMHELSTLTIRGRAGKIAIMLDHGQVAFSVLCQHGEQGDGQEVRTPNATISACGRGGASGAFIVEVEQLSINILGLYLPRVTHVLNSSVPAPSGLLSGTLGVSALSGAQVVLSQRQEVTVTGSRFHNVHTLPAGPPLLPGGNHDFAFETRTHSAPPR